MSVRELGRRLGLSPSLVSRLVRRGMPTEEEEARAWRLQFVRARRRDGVRPGVSTSAETADPVLSVPANSPEQKRETKVVEFTDPAGAAPGGLAASLERLRGLERSTALTLGKLLKEGRIPEAVALRAQHASMIRHLFDAESKALKLAQERGELISVETAVKMVIVALREPVIMLRQLPALGRDPAEREKLTAFMNGVLEAMREGAETVIKSGAAAAAAQGG